MTIPRKLTTGLLLAGATALTPVASLAETLTWSTAGDFSTLDPHAQSSTINNLVLGQIYEPLVSRDNDLKLLPALATSWAPLSDTEWEFKLREGVTFHDGATFDADDAIFSIERAKSPTSDYKVAVQSIDHVEKIDDYTIKIVTNAPSPTLPDWLTTIFMVDQGWAEANDVVAPQDLKAGVENYAARNENGTGPFIVTERIPDVQTVMQAAPDYWDRANFAEGYDTLVHKPVKSAPTRVAGLISGEIDLVLDPPMQDFARIEADPNLKITKALEVRTLFFGFDVKSDTLRYGSGVEDNPFQDRRVRQAVYQAINAEGIQRQIMRGNSVLAGSIYPPKTNGYTQALDDDRLSYDVEAAKALMTEAGYADGFTVTLDCTNNYYVNDEAICQALVPMLAQIGITVQPNLRPSGQAFGGMLKRETSFFLLGFGVPTLDAEYLFRYLLHTPDGSLGTWNFTEYSNPEIDDLIAKVGVTIDPETRNAMMAEIIQRTTDEYIYVPLHHQMLAWAMAKDVEMEPRSDSKPQFKYAKPAK
ncbi:ABC transporter substrate-binding protein [Salipiger sp. P9]|nr:ABC transporter substrate-binding protein [Salipiger pentaromativorans]